MYLEPDTIPHFEFGELHGQWEINGDYVIWSCVSSQVSSEINSGTDEVDCCWSVVTLAGRSAKIEVFSNDDHRNSGLIFSHCTPFSIP